MPACEPSPTRRAVDNELMQPTRLAVGNARATVRVLGGTCCGQAVVTAEHPGAGTTVNAAGA